MQFRQPKQSRSLETTQRYLDAFEELLARQGFARTTIDDIAAAADLTRSAFLARFGSKRQALFLLFDEYCRKVSLDMTAFSEELEQYATVADCTVEISTRFEHHLKAHLGSNRAMHEIFLEELKVDESTQKIFRELIDLMRQVQSHFMADHRFTDTGAFSGAQVLVTTNYNYVLKAMPAMPQDASTRHRMIGRMVGEALKF